MAKIQLHTKQITENTRIAPDGCSSMTFINQGEDEATIMGCVTIEPSSSVSIELDAADVIDTDIEVHFAYKSDNRNLAVIFMSNRNNLKQ